MFRALSTRKIHGGYEKLGDEEGRDQDQLLGGKLKRVTSVPASVYGSSRNPIQELPVEVKKSSAPVKPSGGSVHPLLSFFEVNFQRKKKKNTKKTKTTSKPEFARYLEYVKEGGVWDSNANAPVIYYR